MPPYRIAGTPQRLGFLGVTNGIILKDRSGKFDE